MKKLKGPELKMPALKVPAFIGDLWWDLWDRRLLPLVVLLVAAIAAVPFLMGGGSKEVPESTLAALAAANAEPAADNGAAKLTVVQAEPGLRDYHERLQRLSPTDPFKQRYAGPALTGKLGGESSTSSTTTTTTTSSTESGSSSGESSGSSEPAGSGESAGGGESSSGSTGPSSSGDETAGGAPSSGGGEAKPHVVFFAFAINVKITRGGGVNADPAQKPEKSIKKKVLPLTQLPGEKAPVVTYMGPAGKGKLLLLVSNEVRSISGEGKCVLGKASGAASGEVSGEGACQLLEVEPGFPVTFVFGANEVHYTFNVLKVEAVVVKRIAQNFSK